MFTQFCVPSPERASCIVLPAALQSKAGSRLPLSLFFFSPQDFVAALLERVRGMQKLSTPQKKGEVTPWPPFPTLPINPPIPLSYRQSSPCLRGEVGRPQDVGGGWCQTSSNLPESHCACEMETRAKRSSQSDLSCRLHQCPVSPILFFFKEKLFLIYTVHVSSVFASMLA